MIDKPYIPYRQQLLDPRWQKRRLECLSLHDFACEDCGRRDQTLEVHHCYYVRTLYLWEYTNDLLMCVCSGCHEERQSLEETMHVVLGRVLRGIRLDVLNDVAWNRIHDLITEVGIREALPK